MKIKGTHTVCGREVLIQQIVDNGGHCPWDGQPFNKDYTALLSEALQRAEIAGTALEESLDAVAEMSGALVLDRDSVLADVTASLERTGQRPPARAR